MSIFQVFGLNNWADFVRPPQPCTLCGARLPAAGVLREIGAPRDHGAPRHAGVLGVGVCAPCWRELPWLGGALCPCCALPALDGAVCGACLKRPPHFDATRAALRYDFPLVELVHAYKYRNRVSLAHAFARMMLQGGAPLLNVDYLLPLPATPARLRVRGFNQAAELARLLGRALGVPLHTHALRKVRETRVQIELPWDERRSNVRGAFACDSSVAGKRVALIDDIMTTGASADAASSALKRAGATSVTVWVLARTLRP